MPSSSITSLIVLLSMLAVVGGMEWVATGDDSCEGVNCVSLGGQCKRPGRYVDVDGHVVSDLAEPVVCLKPGLPYEQVL